MQELTFKLMAARKAGTALMELILKLEKDGHLKAVGTQRPVVVLLPEMIAYTAGIFSDTIQVREKIISTLVRILPPEEDEIERQLLEGIKRRAKEFSDNTGDIPEVYRILCRFDTMAQEYDGAFYDRMRVENPGRLSGYYLQLLEAMLKIAEEVAEKRLPDREERIRYFLGLQEEKIL